MFSRVDVFIIVLKLPAYWESNYTKSDEHFNDNLLACEYVLEFCLLVVKYHLMQLCEGELGQSPGGWTV